MLSKARIMGRLHESPKLSAASKVGQMTRKFLKKTIWYRLTMLSRKLGWPLKTVQILAIDSKVQRILLLKTEEVAEGYCPPQGLFKLECSILPPKIYQVGTSAENAAREFFEEAVTVPIDSQRFLFSRLYREGIYRQFDCHIHILPCRWNEFELRHDTAEGKPLWMNAGEAMEKLTNEVLIDEIRKYTYVAPNRVTSA